MAERMTSIRLRGLQGSGLAEYGRQDVPSMIQRIRDYASHQKAIADAILAAPDDAFRVETYVGVVVQRDMSVLQEGHNFSEGARK